MADSALKPSEFVVSPLYQTKNNVNVSSSNICTSPHSFESLRSSSCKLESVGLKTISVPLSVKPAACTTKNRTVATDKKSKSKMAEEVEASTSRLPKSNEIRRCPTTQELLTSHEKDGIPRHQILKNGSLSNELKHRRSNRYDSSESSDSGVVSLSCSDASSWSSSSDITEPVSPSSPTSSQPSPDSQSTLENNIESNSINHSSVELHPVNSPACKIVPKPALIIKLNVDKQAVGNTCMPEIQATTCTGTKRHRRFSDSSTRELIHSSVSSIYAKERGKRVRQLSGSELKSSQSSTLFDNCAGASDRLDCNLNPTSNLTHLQRISLLTRNKANSCRVGNSQNRRDFKIISQRHSWPPIKSLLHPKNGQLKITEFFPTQVKQHWNYSRFVNQETKNEKVQNITYHSNWCSPLSSRVAVVSVAQIDQNNDGCLFNSHGLKINHSLLSNSTFERSITAVPLECMSSTKLQGPAPIRFPIDQIASCHKSDIVSSGANIVQCLWQNCTSRLTSSQSLLEHIQTAHVASQALSASSLQLWSSSGPNSGNLENSISDEVYSCQWEGCKVKGRTSSSRAWLERHVLLHGGHKPFRCIVDMCEQRFNSQAALQRHVNAHFNQESGQSGNSQGLKRENAPAKIIRRNSKKLKHRRNKVVPARIFDYFDSGVMERLRHQLISSRVKPDNFDLSSLADGLTAHSQVIARRLDANGKSRVLLRWTPQDLLPDQWVPEEEIITHKIVSFCNLDKSTQFAFRELFTLSTCTDKMGSKHRRKQ